MSNSKTYDEIIDKIRANKAVVVTAEEMIDIVAERAPRRRQRRWMW